MSGRTAWGDIIRLMSDKGIKENSILSVSAEVLYYVVLCFQLNIDFILKKVTLGLSNTVIQPENIGPGHSIET